MDKRWKCASKEAPKDPFYLIQSNGSDKRYVISLHDPEKIKLLLFNFIRKSRYLDLKVRDMKSPENPTDYVGMLRRKKLLSILEKYDEFLFDNGNFEFMARISRTGEYIVFDDHGLLFIYSKKDYQSFIESIDIAYQEDQKLIYEFNHWHHGDEDHHEKLMNFVNALGMHEG